MADLRDWDYIVLHHTASESGSVASIHEEHLRRKDKNGNAWLGIGYHFVIGNGSGMDDGEIEPTFRFGNSSCKGLTPESPITISMGSESY